jgi:hypothetical protein
MTKSTGVGRGRHSHGMTHHPVYRVWAAMLSRCTNPNDGAWSDYGGRGIRVCDEWRFFPVFWADMGPAYASGLSIDRIDNDDGYRPGNCRWIMRHGQGRNKRSTILIDTPAGKMVQRDIELKLGLARATLSDRKRRGIPLLRSHELEKLREHAGSSSD